MYYGGFLSHSQSYRSIKHTDSQVRMSAFKGITNSIAHTHVVSNHELLSFVQHKRGNFYKMSGLLFYLSKSRR